VLALGSLTAAGGLYRSRILAAGSIGKVAMAAMEDSAIFAGVGTTRDANGDGVLDLPNPAGDIVGVGASIASLRLNGLFVGGAPADSFANSSVAAGLLKAIVLPKVRKANNWPFGLAARRILSLKYEGVALKLPAPFQDSAFELRIA
jgi:hypothetical protein